MRLHSLLAVGVPICVAAGWFELNRARSGHEIAWVYTFEWPIFGIYGVYIWWRLYREKMRDSTTPATTGATRDTAVTSTSASNVTASRAVGDDPELAAWQAYLSNLQSVDPPGKPPGTAA